MADIGNVDEGMCSVYSVPPSETNCSISEALSKQMNAINEFAHESAISVSEYSDYKSEANVSMTDGFAPAALFDATEYTALPSEANATMGSSMEASVYSAPKSETIVTLKDGFEPCEDLRAVYMSAYSAPPSEVGVTMRSGFEQCSDMKALQIRQFYRDFEDEMTAIDGEFLSECKILLISDASRSISDDGADIQQQLGIPAEASSTMSINNDAESYMLKTQYQHEI
ncbi:unnamed protein product [Caenorhabditis bovis]|uniref:Uncharacterized protein n=1 Tax=Caenorhabditis bovis TaxID=2654633 RepID=A0A8S1FD08_9PELO|nr:unnamed protein product [Caenorhabditis bovis]